MKIAEVVGVVFVVVGGELEVICLFGVNVLVESILNKEYWRGGEGKRGEEG